MSKDGCCWQEVRVFRHQHRMDWSLLQIITAWTEHLPEPTRPTLRVDVRGGEHAAENDPAAITTPTREKLPAARGRRRCPRGRWCNHQLQGEGGRGWRLSQPPPRFLWYGNCHEKRHHTLSHKWENLHQSDQPAAAGAERGQRVRSLHAPLCREVWDGLERVAGAGAVQKVLRVPNADHSTSAHHLSGGAALLDSKVRVPPETGLPAAHHAARPAVQGGFHTGLCLPLLEDVHHAGQVGHLGFLVK